MVAKFVHRTAKMDRIQIRPRRHTKDYEMILIRRVNIGTVRARLRRWHGNCLFLGTLLNRGVDSCPELVQVAEKLAR